MTRAGLIVRALIGHHWWWVTILVIGLMGLMAWLGFWQLDRLAQRRAANAQLLAAIESAPIELNKEIDRYSGVPPADIPSDLANRDVTMAGKFDTANQRILIIQTWQGLPGVHLITPFILAGTETAVLVDRGWIPDADYAEGTLYDPGEGLETVQGYIALTETISRRTSDAVVPVNRGNEIYRVDIASISEEMPYNIAPFYIKQSPAAVQSNTLPVREPKEVDLSEGPHLSYAMQWFTFSLGLGIGYVVFVNRWLTNQAETATQHAA